MNPLERAGVPPRLQHCSIDTWEGDYPEQFNSTWDFALIYGPAGTGKSHLAVSELLRSGLPCGAWSRERPRDPERPYLYKGDERGIGALFRDVQESVERMKPPEPVKLDVFLTAEFLVLDDLGAERLTDFTLDRMSLILRHRYNHMKRTVLTTNLTLTQIGEIDPRLASRLLSGIVVKRGGEDRRL